jgi:hypothetical protein
VNVVAKIRDIVSIDTDVATTIQSEPTPVSTMPVDEALELLRCGRRRRVLEVFKRASEPLSVRDVAELVAAWEHQKRRRDLSSDEYKRVYVALYQTHLEKFEDAEVLVQERDEWTPTARLDALASAKDAFADSLQDRGEDP